MDVFLVRRGMTVEPTQTLAKMLQSEQRQKRQDKQMTANWRLRERQSARAQLRHVNGINFRSPSIAPF